METSDALRIVEGVEERIIVSTKDGDFDVRITPLSWTQFFKLIAGKPELQNQAAQGTIDLGEVLDSDSDRFCEIVARNLKLTPPVGNYPHTVTWLKNREPATRASILTKVIKATDFELLMRNFTEGSEALTTLSVTAKKPSTP